MGFHLCNCMSVGIPTKHTHLCIQTHNTALNMNKSPHLTPLGLVITPNYTASHSKQLIFSYVHKQEKVLCIVAIMEQSFRCSFIIL